MNEILIEIIKKSGLKPSEVADKCGVKRQQMYQWVSPKTRRSIKFETLQDIALQLGLNVKISIESKIN